MCTNQVPTVCQLLSQAVGKMSKNLHPCRAAFWQRHTINHGPYIVHWKEVVLE